MKERSANRQLVINMIASLSTFAVGLGVRFFLTPYIVRSLGREAYGFVGLSADILSYTGLVTIALNSMAGRFVTIKYTAGDVEGANKYYSSVFFSNIVLAAFTMLFAAGCILYLEHIIQIPPHLIFDVKLLIGFLAINNVIGLITGIWGVSTFIKNRLDLTNVRGIIGNFINATLLLCLFAFFAPHIWYMGTAGLVMTLYVAITNKKFSQLLTPDLKVRLQDYDWRCVLDLIQSGAWNVVSRLGSIIGHEVDLLLANLFITPSAMGQFAIVRGIPFLVLSLFSTISSVFGPILTNLWAQNKMDEMRNELLKGVRILGFFANIPMVIFFVLSDSFYALWVPDQDANVLRWVTIFSCFGSIFSMPLEVLWNVFTITNKIKVSSLVMLTLQGIIFITWLVGLPLMTSEFGKLLFLCGAGTFWSVVKSLFFLPLYGAHCLKFDRLTFYSPLLKSILGFSILMVVSSTAKCFVRVDSWLMLFVLSIGVSIVGCVLNFYVILRSQDRLFILNFFLRRLGVKHE